MKFTNIQRLLQRQRYYITELHEAIAEMQACKRSADENGELEAEYYFHNQLAKYRKELKRVVEDQRALKALMKEVK
jgi:hypothetical protein